jgi:hypothetical protein
MAHEDAIRAIGADADRLEQAYREALAAGEGDLFATALRAAAASDPENLLYAAWRARLALPPAAAPERKIPWAWAVPLAVLNGLLLWLLSGKAFEVTVGAFYGPRTLFPGVLLFAAPVSAMCVLAFLFAAGARRSRRAATAALALGIALGGAAAYVWLVHPRIFSVVLEEQYLNLMVMHLPLLAWAAVGAWLLGWRRDTPGRFAFLVRSLELFIAGGLFSIACGLFTAISAGLFSAIDIELPESVVRLFVAGCGGLVPVLAVAVVYQADREPARQTFDEGLSRFIATLMRVLLPLTLLVLAVYLVLIPLNFRAAFENRDVLVVYTAMLFAVLALLVGATPVPGREPGGSTAVWLRRAMVATAGAALLVGCYALAAILYRTVRDGLTPNRLAFTGWIALNLVIFLIALIRQARPGGETRFGAWRATFATAMPWYAAWTVLVILVVPWLFATPPAGYASLPAEAQDVVAANSSPILLKCEGSAPIYLLEGSTKRWIRDIPTFEAEGYVWDDVHMVSCEGLRQIPDGPPIPPDAGPPPEPGSP